MGYPHDVDLSRPVREMAVRTFTMIPEWSRPGETELPYGYTGVLVDGHGYPLGLVGRAEIDRAAQMGAPTFAGLVDVLPPVAGVAHDMTLSEAMEARKVRASELVVVDGDDIVGLLPGAFLPTEPHALVDRGGMGPERDDAQVGYGQPDQGSPPPMGGGYGAPPQGAGYAPVPFLDPPAEAGSPGFPPDLSDTLLAGDPDVGNAVVICAERGCGHENELAFYDPDHPPACVNHEPGRHPLSITMR